MGAPILYGLAALGAVVVAGTLAVVAIRAAGGDGSHAAAVASQARPAPPGSAEPSPPVAATRAPGKPAATNDDRSATATPTSLTPEQADALAEAPSCEKLLVGIPPNPGIYPGAAYAQLKVARKALVRGDLDAAQAAFCHALRFDPKNHDVMAGLARLLLIRRDGAAAVQWSREAVKARPEEKSLQLLLGDALALGGDPERAAEPLLLGSGIPTGDGAARKKLAAAQLGLASDAGRRQDAHAVERFHRRAWVLDPTNATAAAGVARALLDQGHAKASLHWARRATTLDPRSASCFVVLGDALSKSGDTSGAAKAWKQATELDPNDATARTRAMTAP